MGLDLRGKRVTLDGLGTRAGGLGVARYLASQGAEVTVTDMRPAEALAEPLAALAGLCRSVSSSAGTRSGILRRRGPI